VSQTPCPVDGCDRPRPGDRQVCRACEADLQRALAAVPELAAELDTTLARQSGSGPTGSTAGSRERPLPYDPRASEAVAVLRNTLVGWVQALQFDHAEASPDNTLGDISAWLLKRLQRLAGHAAAEEAVDEICAAVRAAWRVVDRPPGYLYAGPCEECGCAVYAKPGAESATCPAPDCRTRVEVVSRREWMRGQCEDLLGSSSYVATVCTGLGYPVAESTVREWVRRKHLSARSHADPRGDEAAGVGRRRPLYRVGDVIDVWTGKVRQYAT
jgi:hypothetical protein